MDERPKRKKHRDNPYVLLKISDKGLYKVSFKDGIGVTRIVEITKEVYEAFDNFELEDISEMHEFERHIEHSEVYEENLNKRAVDKPMSLEDEVIRKSTFEDLMRAVNNLPEVQKRRIKKYYFDDLSMVEIAKQENCSKVAVKYSLECAIENLKKILKK